jgi:hypothetical protein
MLPDPMTLENGGTDLSAPRIVSPNPNTGVFRFVDTGTGGGLTLSVIQNGNKTRARSVVRLVSDAGPDAITGIHPSATVTMTIDRPADGSFDFADLLSLVRVLFMGSLTETVVTKILNGEA